MIRFLVYLLGVDEEMRSKAKEGLIQPIQEINIKGDEYSIKTTVGHLSTEVCFKLGVTFPSSSMDGKKIMVIFRNVLRESVSKAFGNGVHFLYAQPKYKHFQNKFCLILIFSVNNIPLQTL